MRMKFLAMFYVITLAASVSAKSMFTCKGKSIFNGNTGVELLKNEDLSYTTKFNYYSKWFNILEETREIPVEVIQEESVPNISKLVKCLSKANKKYNDMYDDDYTDVVEKCRHSYFSQYTDVDTSLISVDLNNPLVFREMLHNLVAYIFETVMPFPRNESDEDNPSFGSGAKYSFELKKIASIKMYALTDRITHMGYPSGLIELFDKNDKLLGRTVFLLGEFMGSPRIGVDGTES